jgi:hypothetical protein
MQLIVTSNMATVVLRIDDHLDFPEEKQTENQERQAPIAVPESTGSKARVCRCKRTHPPARLPKRAINL